MHVNLKKKLTWNTRLVVMVIRTQRVNDPVCLRSRPRASSIDGPVSHINVEQTYCKQCRQLDNSSMLVQALL